MCILSRNLARWPGVLVLAIAVTGIWYLTTAHSKTEPPRSEGDVPAEQPVAENLQLPEEDLKYLWDIEHHGNLLVKYGFGPLADAIRRNDPDALVRMLANDFTGNDLSAPRHVRLAADFAEVERLEGAGNSPATLSRERFAARMLEFRKLFGEKPPGVKFALMTLSPKVRGKLDGPWEGAAQLRLHGEYASGAPAEVVAVIHYEVAEPKQEGLSSPGWLRAASVEQVLTGRAPHYMFAETARQRGIQVEQFQDDWTDKYWAGYGGVYVCDFDRDGFLDVLITDRNGNFLYRGGPDGKFQNVTARVGLPTQPTGLPATLGAWIDIDGDGWEDLILANRIWRNEGGKYFSDYSGKCNLPLPADAVSAVVADYDRDGRLDIYVTRGERRAGSWLDSKTGSTKGNYLFRNLGNWQFADVTQASGTDGGQRSTFSAAWLDVNNDGWPDLHVPNEFGDGVLLVNNGDGTFTSHALANEPADFGTMGLAVGDIDNDGNIDIYCANMYSKAGSRVIGNLRPDTYSPEVMQKLRRFVAGSQLHLNKGGLKFDQVGKKLQLAAVGWAYGPCLADLDGDGFLDIYGTAGFVSRSRDDPDG